MITGPEVGWWLLGQKYVGGYLARSRLVVTWPEVGWWLLGQK